ncbi:MAG: response regulator transcription factor [Deltaproteobacteria bacterium]|nr:response regulator transcription factor [Deltaproteobacteria bacterium]
MKYKILIVEDEPELVGILTFLLKDEGYDTEVAFDGEQALIEINKNKPDLILLDIMLPKIDGFDLCNIIRRETSIPVIILSAKINDEFIIKGLELGADDYVPKPFNHRELILRINKLLQRINQKKNTDQIFIGNICINPELKTVSVGDQEIKLTGNEFNLLHYLAVNENRVLSWQLLLKEIWGREPGEGGNELVKVNIRRLRKKLEPDASNPIYLINIWGMGYKFTSP